MLSRFRWWKRSGSCFVEADCGTFYITTRSHSPIFKFVLLWDYLEMNCNSYLYLQMLRTMGNEFNPPTKRRHDCESAFPYSGHSAGCNCSCYLNDARLAQQRHCTGHESSFIPVGSYAPSTTFRNSANDWRTSSTTVAESHSEPNSAQSLNRIGDILDSSPKWLSCNWSDVPNLNTCDLEGINEPVASGSLLIPQTLWDSGELMKTCREPKERNDFECLAQDFRASNSNEPSGISPETQAALLFNC
jgi:hypothetical protein